jgi:flagellar basal body P-ring formation protein FlgA
VRITIAQDGTVRADDQQVDRLQIALAPQPESLTGNPGLNGNGTRWATVPVELDARAYHEVAVPRRRIEPGELLGGDNVQLDRRAAEAANPCVTARQIKAGARALKPLAPGQPVRAADVEAATEARPVLVRARDLVKLVAQAGNLRVTVSGEALDDGQAGQVIRVRNLDSKLVKQGRVIDRTAVQVDY